MRDVGSGEKSHRMNDLFTLVNFFDGGFDEKHFLGAVDRG